MRQIVFIFAIFVSIVSVNYASAQHNHSHVHQPAQTQTAGNGREFVKFPGQMAEHILANMRDHLAAIHEIHEHLALGHTDVAARVAESRLGMSALGSHGAHEASKYMPKGMQDAGSAMHRAASQFVIVAQDAGVTGDMKPVFSALATITAACVGCHASYRIK